MKGAWCDILYTGSINIKSFPDLLVLNEKWSYLEFKQYLLLRNNQNSYHLNEMCSQVWDSLINISKSGYRFFCFIKIINIFIEVITCAFINMDSCMAFRKKTDLYVSTSMTVFNNDRFPRPVLLKL